MSFELDLNHDYDLNSKKFFLHFFNGRICPFGKEEATFQCTYFNDHKQTNKSHARKSKHHKSNYKQKLSQMMLQVECFSVQRNIICRYQSLEMIENYIKVFDLFGRKVFETIVSAIQA